MNKSIECEFRRPATEVSDAIKRQGIPAGVRGCDKPGDNIDRVCDFLEVTDSSECPQILFDNGKIDEDELLRRFNGG
jgi:hypothetical protein